jgi:hypothetical protein
MWKVNVLADPLSVKTNVRVTMLVMTPVAATRAAG